MKRLLLIAVVISLVSFRFWLAVSAKHGDMYNNLDWGYGALNFGLAKFYELPKGVWTHSRPNQPPGSIYLHLASVNISSKSAQLINRLNARLPIFPSKLVWWWETNGELLSIKLPSIVADLAIAWAIYLLTKKKILALLFLLNPVSWYISSYWGQTDSVVAALIVWSLVFLKEKRIWISAIFLGWSLITKASWAPIAIVWLWYVWLSHKEKIWQIIFIFLPVLLLSWPFHPHADIVKWLFDLYVLRILPGESGFLTVNAFNFWRIFFNNPAIPDTAPFLNLPAMWWGYGTVGLIAAFVLFRLKKNDFFGLISFAVLLQMGYFLFAPRMHERYSFPAWILFTIWLGLKPKRNLRIMWIVFSLFFLINVYSLWYAPTIPIMVNLYNQNFIWSISLGFVLLFVAILNQI